MNYGVKGTRTSILQIQQEPLPGGPIGAGGGRDQLAPTPYQLPRLARPEGCCDMSCDCLSKYHGRASRDALRVWSGWASTVIHGPRCELDYGPRYASGRRPRHTQDQPQRHRAAGPLDQRTDDADTYQWTSRTRAPGVYSRIHVPYAGTTLGGRTRPCWSLLHTAGQDNSGRVIRLHLLGPAAILGSGPEQGREEQRGPTRGGTGGRRRLRRAEPGRAGP